jgi:hypothetical protein
MLAVGRTEVGRFLSATPPGLAAARPDETDAAALKELLPIGLKLVVLMGRELL